MERSAVGASSSIGADRLACAGGFHRYNADEQRLSPLRFVDSKVRVVDSDGGTALRVRVYIRSTDGEGHRGRIDLRCAGRLAFALAGFIGAMLMSNA